MNHVLEDIDVDEDRLGHDTLRFWEERESDCRGWVEVMGCRYYRLGKCTVLVDICAEYFLRKK
jgi:hypothetical protein